MRISRKFRTSRNKPVVTKVSTNTSNSGLSPDVAALTDAVKALLLKNTTPPLASVKAVEESCVTYEGPHTYYKCPATNGNAFPGYQDNIQAYVSAAAVNYNQGNAGHRPPSVAHQAMMLQQNNKLENMLSSYFQMNKPSGLSSGPLPSNIVTNLKGDLKAITTQSGVSYDGPLIPPIFSPSPKVVEKEPEVTKDPVHSSAEKVQPSDVQPQAPTSKPVNAPNPKPNIPYPSRLNNQNLRERDDHQMMKFLQIFRSLHFNLSFSDALLYMPKFASTFKNILSNKEKLFEVANTLIAECLALADLGASINLMPLSIWKKLSLPELTHTQMILELADRLLLDQLALPKMSLMARALIDVYGEELTPRVGDEAITFKVGNTSKFSCNDAESINRIDVIYVACEEYSQEVLGFSGNSESGNPTPTSEPIIAKSSPSLTLFEGGDFMLEEIEANLASDSVPSGIDEVNIIDFFSTFPIPVEDSDFFFEKPETFPSELETFRFDAKENNSDGTTIHANVYLPEYERFYSEGDIHLLEKFLNDDPSSPLLPKEIKAVELKNEKSLVDEPPVLELKDLPSHLEIPLIFLLSPFRQNAKGAKNTNIVPKLEKCRYMVKEGKYPLGYLSIFLAKQDLKLRLLRWILFLQEFDVIIRDKKRAENLAADHLSRLENPHQSDPEIKEIIKTFPIETLGMVTFRGDSNTP
ncbi:hypothetical protein Tco_1168498 [Tanacetum coccineum]